MREERTDERTNSRMDERTDERDSLGLFSAKHRETKKISYEIILGDKLVQKKLKIDHFVPFWSNFDNDLTKGGYFYYSREANAHLYFLLELHQSKF